VVRAIQVEEFFQIAERLQEEADELLLEGDLRMAAEKSWQAALNATNGFILAKIGKVPERILETTMKFHELSMEISQLDEQGLVDAFHTSYDYLHGDVYHLKETGLKEDIQKRIGKNASYIKKLSDLLITIK